MKKRWVILLFLFVVSLWLLTFYLLNGAVWSGIPYAMPESFLVVGDRGTFGDMFGAVNALFSGLAFAGLICTLVVQMQELKAQREELRATREELVGQKNIMEKQSKQVDIQNFESGFFQLLKIHIEEKGLIEISNGSIGVIRGIEAFYVWQEMLESDYTRMFFKSNLEAEEYKERLEYRGMDVNVNEYFLRASKLYLDGMGKPFLLYLSSIRSLIAYVSEYSPCDNARYKDLVLNRMPKYELRCFLILAVTLKDDLLLGFLSRKDLSGILVDSAFDRYLLSVFKEYEGEKSM